MSSILPPSTPAQHPLVLPALIGTLFLSLLPPPSHFRRCIFLPPILYLAYRFHRDPLLPEDPAISYSVATLWTLWARIVVFHLQPDPPESLYRPTWGEKPGDPSKHGIIKKTIWAAHLFSTPRHVGFVSASAPTQTRTRSIQRSRGEFLRWTAIRIPLLYLLLDVCRTFMLTREYTFNSDISLFSIPPSYRWLDTLAYGASAAGTMQLHYHVAGFVSVALGVAEPHSWPPLFGDLRDVDSVAGFWRYGWHQMLTEVFRGVWKICGLSPAPKVNVEPSTVKEAEGDSVKPRVVGRGAAEIVSAFAVSGGGHALSMWTASGGVLWTGQAKFFMFQVVVLGLERAVGWEGTRRGRNGNGKVRWIGQIWMAAVILTSGAWMGDEMGRVGMYRTPPVPGSVVRPVLRSFGLWDGRE